jgi:hypothetical protein
MVVSCPVHPAPRATAAPQDSLVRQKCHKNPMTEGRLSYVATPGGIGSLTIRLLAQHVGVKQDLPSRRRTASATTLAAHPVSSCRLLTKAPHRDTADCRPSRYREARPPCPSRAEARGVATTTQSRARPQRWQSESTSSNATNPPRTLTVQSRRMAAWRAADNTRGRDRLGPEILD